MNEQKFIEEMLLTMSKQKFTEETLHMMLYFFLKIVRTKKLAILQTNISKMT